MAHTLGPWEVAPHPDDAEMVEIVRDFVELSDGRKQAQWIAECNAGVDSDMSDDEWQEAIDRNHANARLIAAAPILLAALKRAEQAIHSEYCSMTCHPECVAVTDAIAKAEGR